MNAETTIICTNPSHERMNAQNWGMQGLGATALLISSACSQDASKNSFLQHCLHSMLIPSFCPKANKRCMFRATTPAYAQRLYMHTHRATRAINISTDNIRRLIFILQLSSKTTQSLQRYSHPNVHAGCSLSLNSPILHTIYTPHNLLTSPHYP